MSETPPSPEELERQRAKWLREKQARIGDKLLRQARDLEKLKRARGLIK